MSEKIAQLLGPEPRTLKVGKSFERNSGRNAASYHGIRYDFKPVSIDEERDGTLEVRERKEVAVSLPHVGGSGQTNYKGHINESNPKDCVLVIDHETGEITIERLSNQILLKKTRPEKADNKSLEEKLNPYEVKKIPERPNFPSRETVPAAPSSKRTIPLQASETDTSSSSRGRSSPVPPVTKPRNIQPKTAAQVPESSSSSSSDSSSDSSEEDSDFEDNKVPGVGGMPKFIPQDAAFSRGGGVLPTARPQSHKSKKSQDSSNKSRSKTHQNSNKMEMPTLTAPVASASLDDDLRLSEDSD